jgi:hypothetical protein
MGLSGAGLSGAGLSGAGLGGTGSSAARSRRVTAAQPHGGRVGTAVRASGTAQVHTGRCAYALTARTCSRARGSLRATPAAEELAGAPARVGARPPQMNAPAAMQARALHDR